MAILPSNPIITLPHQTNPSNQAIKITLGQTYQINITQIKGNQVQFNLGGQTFLANTRTPLSESGQLAVKVTQTTPNVQLTIVSPKPTTETASNQIATLTRQLLPNQMPINQAIQLLSNPQFIQQLPPAIQSQLQVFMEQLFKPNAQVSGQTLKNMIQKSGLFFENGLLKRKENPQQDLKAKLLKLSQEAQSLNQTQASHAKLSAILQKTLNKITLQQIQLFENPALNLQVPLSPESNFKNIQLDIRKNKHLHKPSSYEVLLNLTLEQGKSTTKIILNDESDISLYLWATPETLQTQIKHALPLLKSLFNDAGIAINNIQMSKNQPSSSKETARISLIDIKI